MFVKNTKSIECRFEIIVTFTGSSSLTGQISESRTSYLSNEVLWGHRFVNMIEYDAIKEQYFVEYNRFDVTEAVRFLTLVSIVFFW